MQDDLHSLAHASSQTAESLPSHSSFFEKENEVKDTRFIWIGYSHDIPQVFERVKKRVKGYMIVTMTGMDSDRV